MRVAILESIIMPAGHEVEFDRMIINELKRQGHEPVLMVPENLPLRLIMALTLSILRAER